MTRFIVAVAAVLAAAAPARAQDEYELAGALAERGWYDLSEELYTKITRNASLPPEQKAEGTYGLARLKITMAERAETPEEKTKLYDKAIKEVDAFLKEFPTHRRRGEALSDIGYLYQSKGKTLMTAAKADPGKLGEAEKAFGAAEKLFLDLIAQLQKEEKKLPEDPKNTKAIEEFEQWEEKLMFAKYNYATALFSHAETYKDNPSKHADMKKLLETMTTFLNNDFMWLYERYLLAYDASIYVGRSFQILAETSEGAKADDYWKQCFINVGRAKSLLTDPENRKNDAVRDIAGRSIMFEMKARLAYGDSKRGQAASREYTAAGKLAEDYFRMFPNARDDEMGKAIQLEQARVYCKSGALKKGVELLQVLAKKYKESWVENIAVDILGEYGADQSPSLAVDAANNFFERGPAYYYKAIQKYRKALLAIRKPEDQKYAPECWYKVGLAYYFLDRYYECVATLSLFEKPPLQGTSDAPKAALLKLQSLQKIAKATKDKADEKVLEDFKTFVTKAYPKEAGDQLIRQTAIEAEGKQQFADAAAKWEQIAKAGSAWYEEALFSIGYNLFREGDRLFGAAAKEKVGSEREKKLAAAADVWKRSQEFFKKHLDHVDKLPVKDPPVIKNAIGSVMFSCRILVNDKVNRPDEALALSNDLDKRFPSADPRMVISIMAVRIDAKLKKGLVQEAEEDLKTLKAKFEKEQLGLDHYANALSKMANAYMEAAAKEKGKDAEKYDLFGMKSANYYYEYYLLNPSSISGKLDQMEGMGQMLFMAAEQRMKAGQAKNDKDMQEEARKIYARARDLYKEVLLQKEADLLKAGKRDEVRSLNARITRCLLMTGQFDDAIKMYEAITRDDQAMRDGSSWEELSDCYVEQARSLPKGSQRNELLKRADKVYGQLAAMLMQNSTYSEHTWRLLYKHCECLMEIDLDALAVFFKNMQVRGHAPKWDSDEKGVSQWGFQPKFESMRQKLEAVLPPRK